MQKVNEKEVNEKEGNNNEENNNVNNNKENDDGPKKEKQVQIEKEIEAGNKNEVKNKENNYDTLWDDISNETFDKIVSTTEENKKLAAKESNILIRKSKRKSMTPPTFSLGMGLSPLVAKTHIMETKVISKVVKERLLNE
ncbi:hypothetical protein Tco_0438610 [Tanacetum coccineum]